MHDERAVEGLIDLYPSVESQSLNPGILKTLARLYQKEAPYDGSWWWSTRPDTRGPYYKPITWEGSEKIKTFLMEEWGHSNPSEKAFFAELNTRYRMEIPEFGEVKMAAAQNEEVVDLGMISNKKGQVGKASIEDVMLAIDEMDGDVNLGAKLFTRQGCNACHSIKKGEPLKGPYMGQIGSIMTRDQIAESILKPNASISQGFASVLITAKGKKSYVGFISEESADQIVMRNIAGQVYTIPKEDVLEREELEMSMMPMGLANSLSFEEFAALVTFLAGQKG
jgi:putative heme-binding domain-containing protein